MIYKNKDIDIERRAIVTTGSDTEEDLGVVDSNSKYNANAVVACSVYLVCSVCMVLTNKVS